MKSFLLASGLIVLCLGLLLISGCSDDGTINPGQKEQGDLTDSVFQQTQDIFDGVDEFDHDMLGLLIEFIGTVFEDPENPSAVHGFSPWPSLAATADSFSFAYHTSSEYWYFYLSREESLIVDQTLEDIITLTVIDSVQFLHGATPVQWPDSSLLTGVKNGVLMTVNTSSGLGNLSADQDMTIVGDIVNQGVVTLNGQSGYSFTVIDQQDSCEVSSDITGEAADVVVDLSLLETDLCPTSGTLTHTGTFGIECTGDFSLSFSDTWAIVQTFNGDSISVVFENSTTRWTYTEACADGGVAASPFERLLGVIRPE